MNQRFFVFRGSKNLPQSARRGEMMTLYLYEQLANQFVTITLEVSSIEETYRHLMIWGDTEINKKHYTASVKIDKHYNHKSNVILNGPI